jgi:hypothetical protein
MRGIELLQPGDHGGVTIARHDPIKPNGQDNTPPTGKELVAYPLQAFADIQLDLTQRPYLVKGVIPNAGLTVVWGPPKCYKSFGATDIALHIALNWEYRGLKVRQAPVVYVALEGQRGFPDRIEAFKRQHGVSTAPFYLLATSLDLVKKCDQLIASIRAQLGETLPGAVFLDTLNRSLVGSESKDEDMAAYLSAAEKVAAQLSCAVIIVHHCGIDASRPRGHTSLTGAVESQIKVERPDDYTVIMTVEYAKDFEEGTKIVSRLEKVILGIDADGDKCTSLAVLPVDTATASSVIKTAEKSKFGKAKRETKGQRAFSDALNETLDNLGKFITPRAGMTEVKAAKVSDIRAEFDKRYVVDNPEPDKARHNKGVQFNRQLNSARSALSYGTGNVEGADWMWKL